VLRSVILVSVLLGGCAMIVDHREDKCEKEKEKKEVRSPGDSTQPNSVKLAPDERRRGTKR
jgi:hypothetical protein